MVSYGAKMSVFRSAGVPVSTPSPPFRGFQHRAMVNAFSWTWRQLQLVDQTLAGRSAALIVKKNGYNLAGLKGTESATKINLGRLSYTLIQMIRVSL